MARCPAPGPADIHLWRAPLDVGPHDLPYLSQPLSTDERDRALRFRAEIDRVRFTAGRGWLRHLLADYLDTDPSELAFSRDPGGKPRLEQPDAAWLQFSLSHSGNVVAFAVATGRKVGVDIEKVQWDFPVESVADRFFKEDERRDLALMPSATARAEAFFALWTRKESYLKGIGTGFGDPDSGLRAGVVLGPAAAETESSSPEFRGWTLAAFDVGAGYAATVAVEGRPVRIPAAARELSLKLA